MKCSVVITAALVAMLASLTTIDRAWGQVHSYASSDAGSFASSGFAPGPGGEFYTGDFSSGEFCSDGSCGGTNGGCADCWDGGGPGYGGSWLDYVGLGDGNTPRWFVTADYLYVRASFSEAIAYIEQNIDDPANSFDTFHELNFQHDSSYRFGGGYKLGCCDEEIRFMFTRMNSYASAIAPVGSFVAYETTSPDGPTLIDADVDTKSFDLDYRKTIPLGGPVCTDCGDTCSDACCGPACPAWDITWSGGLRFAEVDWNRNYFAVGDAFERFRETNSTLNFDGGGPRVGLEGRRYFGKQNWCSVFLKGDISVLLGQMSQQVQRIDENNFVTTQTARGRRIIPVTEIEAGLSAKLTKRSLLSAGYLFSAWHDLGFRDQFNFATQLESNYDDANILGFDGFFARLEFGY